MSRGGGPPLQLGRGRACPPGFGRRRRGGPCRSGRAGRAIASTRGRSGARPIPPVDDDDVAADGLLERPARPERAAQADLGAGAQLDDPGRGRAGGPDRQLDAVGQVARDRDRHRRVGRQRDHRELARPAGQEGRVDAVEDERRDVAGLAPDRADPGGRVFGRRGGNRAGARPARVAPRAAARSPSAPCARRCRPGTRRCTGRSRRSRTCRTGRSRSRTCGSATGGSGRAAGCGSCRRRPARSSR